MIFPERDIENCIVTKFSAFADKQTSTGKLYRRKHGFSFGEIADGASATLALIVPYDVCKINELEIVNGKDGITVDLIVHDTPNGDMQLAGGVPPGSEVPSAPLNQFGFGVELPEGFYRDSSEYDADLIKDMEVRITAYNNSGGPVTLKGNIVYHEIK